jgi:hypothetical protein
MPSAASTTSTPISARSSARSARRRWPARGAGRAGGAHAGGVDQQIGAPAVRDRRIERIARRAGARADDGALVAGQPVEQRRLADVGSADDRHRGRRLAGGVDRLGRGQDRRHRGDQRLDPEAVLGRDRMQGVDPQGVELAHQLVLLRRVDLVHRHEQRLAEPAQPLQQHAVERVETGAAIDDHDHGVGRLGCQQRLPAHRPRQFFLLVGLETAGVHDQHAAVVEQRRAHVAVARDARRGRHQRSPRPRQAVEQRRLTGVRPPHQGDDRQTGELFGARQ